MYVLAARASGTSRREKIEKIFHLSDLPVCGSISTFACLTRDRARRYVPARSVERLAARRNSRPQKLKPGRASCVGKCTSPEPT